MKMSLKGWRIWTIIVIIFVSSLLLTIPTDFDSRANRVSEFSRFAGRYDTGTTIFSPEGRLYQVG